MCMLPKVPKVNASDFPGNLSPNVQLPDVNTGAVRVAGDAFRKRRQNARGIASTLLSSPAGGGGSPAAPVATKILLGS